MSIVQENQFIPTRQSLLERLRQWNDQESWQEFFDTYWKLIYRTAVKAGLRDCEAEEVVQETIIIVAKKMPGFVYRPPEQGGSFKQWLLRVTKWRINDQLRRRYRDQVLVEPSEAGVEDEHFAEIPDPVGGKLDDLWEREWEQNLLDAALERVKKQADPRDFQVFQLSAIKGWSGLKVSRSMKVSVANVYTIRHRLAKELKSALQRLCAEGFANR